MADTTTSDVPFIDAPAPWELGGEAFWLFGYSNGKQFPSPAQYPSLERTHSFASAEESGAYKGGLCSVMIVRYRTSPVGKHCTLFWRCIH